MGLKICFLHEAADGTFRAHKAVYSYIQRYWDVAVLRGNARPPKIPDGAGWRKRVLIMWPFLVKQFGPAAGKLKIMKTRYPRRDAMWRQLVG